MSKRERKLPKRRAVIFVYDGVQVLDVAGTAQSLTTANEEGATPQYDLRICGLAGGAVTTHRASRSLRNHRLGRARSILSSFREDRAFIVCD